MTTTRRAIIFVCQGDTIDMHSLDRLGCNLDDLRQRADPCTGQGIQLEAIKEQFIFASEDFPNDKTIACSYGRLCGLNYHYHVN